MNQAVHVETGRELVRRADEGTGAVGKHLVAAEFLQGVFAHCPITVALNDGLPHDSHGVFRRAAPHPDNVLAHSELRSGFKPAEQLHGHLYHGDLSDAEMRNHRRRTREGTLELLRVLLADIQARKRPTGQGQRGNGTSGNCKSGCTINRALKSSSVQVRT